jgi:hypothetical protein
MEWVPHQRRNTWCCTARGTRARLCIETRMSLALIHILDRPGLGAEGALSQRRRHEFVEVTVEHA